MMVCLNPTEHGHVACGSACKHECEKCKADHIHNFVCSVCGKSMLYQEQIDYNKTTGYNTIVFNGKGELVEEWQKQ